MEMTKYFCLLILLNIYIIQIVYAQCNSDCESCMKACIDNVVKNGGDKDSAAVNCGIACGWA
ncbi:hypothetical protein K492DRAFT_173332 [Lichtheimia hyalospora FSU 10163]|nr:hypothetical protein K492DRAFT_173332 [Lichtheimia hyalospora FSU 10163]